VLFAILALPLLAQETNNKVQPQRHWVAGPDDRIIAMTTGDMLTKCHYLHLPLDELLSTRFYSNYLNTLDPQHIHFLQTDLDEFDRYRTNMAILVGLGDTTPAYLIYNRFMQRLEERTAYALELLRTDPFEFTADEDMPLSRKNAAPPKDMNEARQLWRQRLRYEYLQEKLNKESRGELARQMVSRFQPFSFALAGREFRIDIVQFITRRYNRIQRNFRDWESDKVLETYLSSLGHVYDPHTDYYDRSDLENFSIQMSLTLFGIGATLMQSDDGYTTITALVPNGPAEKSKKLKVNDRIVSVAQGTNESVDVVDMPLNHVVDKIRGPKGTDVRLSIIPSDAVDLSKRVEVKLVRDEIKLVDQQAKASLVELAGPGGQAVRLGVIDLPSFYASFPMLGGRGRPQIKSTTLDVIVLLGKLKKEGVQGVILDLRHNGGGSLEEAINLTGLFIKQGPVVQVAGSDGSRDVRDDADPAIFYDGPLIILTSRFSASASEILAAALQDYGRALIVGDKATHGKGTVQSMSQLAPYLVYRSNFRTNDPAALGALKYTTNLFYRVNGKSTQLLGVIPDIQLPSTYDFMELLGEASLDNALSVAPIQAVEYEKFNMVQPVLAELRSRSAARVESDKDFAYVREDIEQVKKVMGDKSISLNENRRLTEIDENETRAKEREKELKARKWTDEKIFDLTLKQSDEPGLPLPLVITNGVIVTNAATASPGAKAGTTTPADTNLTASVTPKATAPKTTSSVDPEADMEDDAAGKTISPADLAPLDRAHLTEAERILMDYIALWKADSSLTAKTQSQQKN
jgi:carboxyl-terminal processing protease